MRVKFYLGIKENISDPYFIALQIQMTNILFHLVQLDNKFIKSVFLFMCGTMISKNMGERVDVKDFLKWRPKC